MKIEKIKTSFSDERGDITDIMVKENVEYVTLITSAKGVVRGNHYHKETVQWAYLLKGKMKILTQFPGQPVEAGVMTEGDLVLTGKNERHAMEALEDSTFLVFTRGPRGAEDYEKDTFRLAEPLTDTSAS